MKHRTPFENLKKSQIAELLRRAIEDNRVKDSVLFMFESGLKDFYFTDGELEILKSYYNKQNKLMATVDQNELERIQKRRVVLD